MGTAEMVGSMGLTLFCNKCVDLFYKFQQDGELSGELKETCKQAISAFKSLKWPNVPEIDSQERVALFNTNEEIKSFEKVITSDHTKKPNEALDALIEKLEVILEEVPQKSDKTQAAKKLQGFFDTLGDYSFYTTKECLRTSEITVRM